MKRSGIREVMDLSAGLEDVIHLEVGEPLFATPPHIVAAASAAGLAGFTKYTQNAGYMPLRKAIVRRLSDDYGLTLEPTNIVITVGGVGALATAVRAIADEGDEILIPDPGWPNYEMIVACAGATPRRYQLDPTQGYMPNMANLESAVSRKTKAIIINSPSNPLGVVFPSEVVRELVEFARRRDLFVVSDEVYDKIVFEGRHTSALSLDTDGRVIGAFSCSKTYAMTGWRVGYAVAAESVAKEIAKLQEVYVSCACSVSQRAAEAAISGEQNCVDEMRLAYYHNLCAARQILDRHGIKYQVPKGAFYVWIYAGCNDSAEFAKRLLIEEKVAVAPGSTFGTSGREYIRISLASSLGSITEGLERVAAGLKNEAQRRVKER